MKLGILLVLAYVSTLAQPVSPQTVMVPMRDDVKLATDVYNAEGASKRPVLLMRTPYNKNAQKAAVERFAAAGYIVVVQDTRGRFASQGTTLPYNNDGQDGFDTLDWINRQPWSNGHVGMWGASHVGAVQWQAAAEQAYGLTVLAPTATWSSFYRNIYQGGAVRLALITPAAARSSGETANVQWSKLLLHLPLVDIDTEIGWRMPWLTGILAHNRPDGFWKRLDLTREVEGLNLPVQHVVGYYDFFCRETVANFLRLRQHGNQQLILGPWDHGTIGKSRVADVDFGAVAQIDLVGENLAWFDRFLKKAPAEPFSPVRYFSMGDGVWCTADDWPPRTSKQVSLYLRSGEDATARRRGGRLSLEPPRSAEAPGLFRADPADPAPAVPKNTGREKYAAIWGPVDQRGNGNRPDILSYDLPLSEPLEFAGPLAAELWVSADTPDADWVVKLIDVRPDGFEQNLAVGIQRGAFRDSEINLKPLKPGEKYRIRVDVGHAAARLLADHRLRVEITGAYFPLYDRNPNTAEGPTGSRTLVATETVWHSPGAASRVILPIIKRPPPAKGAARSIR